MIANTSPQNMGSITALSIVLATDVASMLHFNGSAKITYASGKSATSVYFTPGTATVNTPLSDGGMHAIELQFRSPNDRPALFAAIKPFINQKVVMLATDGNGQVKVYGSTQCPLLLTYAPTSKGLPSNYNGIELQANGLDFAPGRYLVA